MKPGLTEAQTAGADHAASVWVAASAGTGKTHLLTARLLRLMLTGTPPDHLLCLTFTRAAAALMISRLRQTLGDWVRLSDAALAADIHAVCGLASDADMRARARRLFAEVLDLGDGLRIQTIHAFCQSLLARFPLEAGLAPGFAVIEETTSADLLRQARDKVIDRSEQAGQDRLHRAMAMVAAELGEDAFLTLIKALTGARRHIAALMQAYGGVEGSVAALRRALELSPDATPESELAAACAAIPKAEIAALADAFAQHGGKIETEALPGLRAMLDAAPADRPALWSAYIAAFLTQAGEPRKTGRYPVKAVQAAMPDALDLVDAEAARVHAVETRCRLLRATELTGAALRVGQAITEAYDRAKAAEGGLDYDDLIARTDALLSTPGVADWILYKMDGRIDHVLVDEAQDTNAGQWRIIESLCADFFAGAGAREALRTVFAVGDVKQSIYRFQGARPQAFIDARDHVRARSGAAGTAFATVPLDLSFRSTAAVLDLVDAVFADPAAAAGLALDDAPIVHRPHRVGEAGLVELWPVEPKPERPEAEPWSVPDAQEPEDSAEARLAVRIARRIDAMLKDGERLEARARAIRPRDIMVLVRRRTPFVDYLVRKLKMLGVPVAGSDRMDVAAQLGVMDVLALLQAALLPEDDLNLAVALRGPLIGMDEDALYALAHDRGRQRLWARLREQGGDDAACGRAWELLTALRARADYSPPFEFLSAILTEFGGRRALAARLGGEVHDPLDELLRLAQSYELDHPPSLQGFLHWIGQGEAVIKRDPEQRADEVRIMTVHGAKGLQAPVVFLPDCCGTPSADDPLLHIAPALSSPRPGLSLLAWRGSSNVNEVGPLAAARDTLKQDEDAEYRRLLYVALTRAEDRLYVAGWEAKKGGGAARTWHELIADGFALLADVEEIAEGPQRTLLRHACPQKIKAEAEMEDSAPGGETACPDWARQPASAEPRPSRPLAPSRMAGGEPAALSPLSGGRDGDALLRGRVIHRLLELLPDLPPAARRDAAARFLAQPAFGLDGETAAAWRDEVMAILDDPAFAPLFAAGSLAEAPITGVIDDGRVVSGQVDRLAVTDDAVFVVDYKTNRPVPPDAGSVPAPYRRQMAAYRAVLARLYPDRVIRTALLWTDTAQLMEITGD
mgnify:CR=1 FL=1